MIHYVLHARNAGFFSNFNGVVNRLHYTLAPQDTCEVSWRVDQLRDGRHIVPQTQFPYGTVEDGNLWTRFFEPLPLAADGTPRGQTREIWELEHQGWCFGTYHAAARRASRLYAPGRQQWRWNFHDVYRRFIRPLPQVLERAARFHRTYLAGRHSVGLHIRNVRHRQEQVGQEAYGVPDFVQAVRRLYGAEVPTIFLATDSDAVIQAMHNEFGQAVVYQTDVVRSPAGEDEQLHFFRQGDVRFGNDVLSDGLLLAACDRLIHVTSNVATAAAFINPDLDMHYIGRFEPPARVLWDRLVGAVRRARPWPGRVRD
jgi:hypothetical protein